MTTVGTVLLAVGSIKWHVQCGCLYRAISGWRCYHWLGWIHTVFVI